MAEHEMTVVLSSHLISDVERVCDHLVVLAESRVRIAGDVEELLSTHHRLTGARGESCTLPGDQQLVSESHTERQTTLLVRTDGPVHDPWWTVCGVTLDDLILAYMGDGAPVRDEPSTLAVVR